MNRILFESREVGSDGAVTVTDARAEHLRNVLAVRPGQVVRVGVLDGPAGTASVETVDAAGIRLRCTLDAAAPARPRVDLLLAVPRPKVLKRLWAPLASLGVGRIVLTTAAKVERAYFATHWLRSEAYRPLLVEGLQQAGDTLVPEVRVVRRLKPFVEDRLDEVFPGAVRLVADPSAVERLSAVPLPDAARVLLAVGPEGGWTPFELGLLQRHGFRCVGAGPRTLRSDVACIALLAVLHERLHGA